MESQTALTYTQHVCSRKPPQTMTWDRNFIRWPSEVRCTATWKKKKQKAAKTCKTQWKCCWGDNNMISCMFLCLTTSTNTHLLISMSQCNPFYQQSLSSCSVTLYFYYFILFIFYYTGRCNKKDRLQIEMHV